MDFRELESLRKRLEEEERRRKQAEQQRDEAEQQRDAAEQQLKHRTQKTTLPEFLDACHQHLFLGLQVQKDKESSTKGDPANAEQKFRPDHIREWSDFPREQSRIWKLLMDVEFVAERHFTPLLVLEDNGNDLRQRSLSSELDLGYFARQTVETRIASVVKQLYQNSRLREIFQLKGDVVFENHANTLTDETELAADMDSMTLKPAALRRSGRLAAKSEGAPSAPVATRQECHPKTRQQKRARPRADQFCVYNKGSSDRIPAFVVEYKAPHKLSLAHIKAGLRDMDLDDIVRLQDDEAPEVACRRVVAAVITQVYSYMITGNIPFGYVCTGEAYIYIRVKRDDPKTAYYFLSVPKEDVGESTGWIADSDGDNRLHLTALGQALAFTLRALQITPRDLGWVKWAEAMLQRWEMVYDDILGEVEEKEIPSSEFKPAGRSRDNFLRMSPVRTRSKALRVGVASCDPPHHLVPSDDDENSDEGGNPDTPSRSPRVPRAPNSSSRRAATETSRDKSARGPIREYCTQRCLRGLQIGSLLDPTCPNVSYHGVDRHQLRPAELIHLLFNQFNPDDLHEDSQLGCQSLHIHGKCGALFKVTLISHGYTLVGKGVPDEFVARSRHEEKIYGRLADIQGRNVPVMLGGLGVDSFYADGGVQISRLILMGYAGTPIMKAIKQCPEHRDGLIDKAVLSLRAVQKCGILHSDPIPNNILWNGENGRAMLIDFERATVSEQRTPLMAMSPNRKRKRVDTSAKNRSESGAFDREIQRLRNFLS